MIPDRRTYDAFESISRAQIWSLWLEAWRAVNCCPGTSLAPNICKKKEKNIKKSQKLKKKQNFTSKYILTKIKKIHKFVLPFPSHRRLLPKPCWIFLFWHNSMKKQTGIEHFLSVEHKDMLLICPCEIKRR